MITARLACAVSGLSFIAACEGTQNVLAPASPDARLIASLSWWMFALAVLILIVTLGLLLVAVALRRNGEARAISRRRATILVVLGGVVAPICAIVAVTVSGAAIGDETEGGRRIDGATVRVAGERWWWEFSYLAADGEVLAVTANELHLPVGRRSRILLESDNVIHSFWAPNLQGKTDLIPGATNMLFAEPEVSGEWRGQCAEFCGLQHGLMGFLVIGEPPEDFAGWLAAQAEPAAVTSHPGLGVFLSLGCGECHTIRGSTADGEIGPDLTHLASRRTLAAATLPNTRGHLAGWITSTQEIKPGALMPEIVPDPADLQHLLDFLEALE
ncbi:cytochrome c oxidase subunit II [Roseitranquillus sediminis]|uniref:cytochrome c oxidase subunit II n=1 Tax=Roseitranquillus sediminis TaxID=2809051 RepID=UPI001D0C59F7|nr:c-type cytochrome [Roseitranquillus sediminis]MBM9596004.1 cytochrome B [Roseitranquillus sediminis]